MKRSTSIPNARRLLIALALLGSPGLWACAANLQAVRDFAKTSAATAEYPQVVSNYAEAPIRMKRYAPARAGAALDADAKERAAQAANFEAAQKILVEYMSTLGDLAADELPNVDSQVDGLGKALEKAKFVGDGDAAIKKETASAASAIAKVLVRVVLDRYRQRQLVQIIRDTDPHVQVVVAGLREVVRTDFDRALRTEAEAIDKYFKEPIAAAQARRDEDAVPPLARIMLLDRMDVIEGRRAKLEAYAKALTKIGEGHAELNKNVDKLDGEALKQRLKQDAKDLRALYKAIQELN